MAGTLAVPARLTCTHRSASQSAGGALMSRMWLMNISVVSFLVVGPAQMVTAQSQRALRTAAEDSGALAQIRAKLTDPVTLEFVETPLGDVIAFLKDYTGVNIVLDRAALDEVGVSSDTPISIHV